MTELPLTGGCLCGELRFEVAAEPIDAGYCHCRICQRLSGAPAMAWASVPSEAFRYTLGVPRIHRSSDWGQREFCGACGSQLLYRTVEPAPTLDVNLPTWTGPRRSRRGAIPGCRAGSPGSAPPTACPSTPTTDRSPPAEPIPRGPRRGSRGSASSA